MYIYLRIPESGDDVRYHGLDPHRHDITKGKTVIRTPKWAERFFKTNRCCVTFGRPSYVKFHWYCKRRLLFYSQWSNNISVVSIKVIYSLQSGWPKGGVKREWVISFGLKSFLWASSNIFKLATEFYNVMTQHARVDTKLLGQLLNCCGIGVEVHQPVTEKKIKSRQVSVGPMVSSNAGFIYDNGLHTVQSWSIVDVS